jgi:hypothetical protein
MISRALLDSAASIAGERIAIWVKSADDYLPVNSFASLARNHLRRARITMHHGDMYSSRLELPITRGNIFGTFLTGGGLALSK